MVTLHCPYTRENIAVEWYKIDYFVARQTTPRVFTIEALYNGQWHWMPHVPTGERHKIDHLISVYRDTRQNAIEIHENNELNRQRRSDALTPEEQPMTNQPNILTVAHYADVKEIHVADVLKLSVQNVYEGNTPYYLITVHTHEHPDGYWVINGEGGANRRLVERKMHEIAREYGITMTEPTTENEEQRMNTNYVQYDLFGNMARGGVPPTSDAWVDKLTWGFENETYGCYDRDSVWFYLRNVDKNEGCKYDWEVVSDCSIECDRYDDDYHECNHECDNGGCYCSELDCEGECECEDEGICDTCDNDEHPDAYSHGMGLFLQTHGAFPNTSYLTRTFDTAVLARYFGCALLERIYVGDEMVDSLIYVPFECVDCAEAEVEQCLYCTDECECDVCTGYTECAYCEGECDCTVCNIYSCDYCEEERMNSEHDAEVVSPVFDDSDSFEDAISTIDELHHEAELKVNESCGLHVHVGVVDTLSLSEIKSVVNAFLDTQQMLKLMTAEWRRDKYKQYANDLEITKSAVNECETLQELWSLPGDRYTKLNVQSLRKHGTLEWRMHEAVESGTHLVRWAQFCVGFVSYYANNAYVDETLSEVIARAASQVKDGDKVVEFYAYLNKSN